jgi:aryl-alcohol dehydrogenase-like predicted oxidoreductase
LLAWLALYCEPEHWHRIGNTTLAFCRKDPHTPIEESVRAMKELVEEGKVQAHRTERGERMAD